MDKLNLILFMQINITRNIIKSILKTVERMWHNHDSA